MHLDCEHVCNKICHKRSSHAKMECTQPCRRTQCPEKHPCPKQCFEDCGKCLVDMVKKLPCGHEVHLPILVPPNVYAFYSIFLNREKSNAGSSRKMRTVKSKWKGFYPIVSIQQCLTVVHLPMDTNAPAFAGNCYATTGMYAASPVVNPVGSVTSVLNANLLAAT